MRFREVSWIPPNCPSSDGRGALDATHAEFVLDMRYNEAADDYPAHIDVLGTFSQGESEAPDYRTASTDTIDASTDTPFGEALVSLRRQYEIDPAAADSFRQALLERIDTCHGLIPVELEPGETMLGCWALCADGMEAVLRQTLDVPPETPEIS
ncbi:MAG TPA: hypothetical protein VJP80_02735 [Candidatus Saccharimonadales bacterium]|nr:hypothetical protein [Candidatus Saccharimonadales bacterium]